MGDASKGLAAVAARARETMACEASRVLETLLTRKRELEKQLEAVRDEFRRTSGRLLVEHFADLFARHPEVKGLRWRQYTPFFNDGDACTFSSQHEDAEILFLEHEGDDEPVTLDDSDIEYKSDRYNSLRDVEERFRAAFPDLTDDDMEALFGDHVAVTIYPDRVEAEEYDHD